MSILLLELLLLGSAPKAASKLIARSLMARIAFLPAVVVHELAHAIMVILVGGKLVKVVLYRPVWKRRQENEGVYGYVNWQGTGMTWRQPLVSIAPLILIAPLVGLATLALLGIGDGASLGDIASQPIWLLVGLGLMLLVLPMAAFPSPGDKVGFSGLIVVVGIPSLVVWMITGGDLDHIAEIVSVLVIALAPMSVGAAILLALSHGRQS